MHYRRDIDGLRAVAVTPVVLFHAGAPGFSGGFVGVDIFFVISGFLITGVLLGDHEKRRYSLLRFYDRRIRRILPALFAMLLASTLAASLILLPSELANFSKALLATALFGSNVLFFRQSGYFAPDSHDNALLHTWSLSVEEQFYIVFPVALWALYRIRAQRHLAASFLAAGLLSLAIAEFLLRSDRPEAAFYLLPGRAWELLLGSWLAAYRKTPSRWAAEGMGAAGLALVAFAIVTYTAATPFPGLAATVPCLGTLLILWSGRRETAVSRLLSHPLPVGIGLISYSLYLWHWPLLVLPRIHLQAPLTGLQATAAVGAAVAVAYLSWRYVERPFRKGGDLPAEPARWRSIAVAAATILVCITVGAGLSSGLPQRVSPAVARLDRAGELPAAANPCAGADADEIGACLAGARLILWGDSHAAQYAKVMPQAHVASIAGCAPLIGATALWPSGEPYLECERFNHAVLAGVEPQTTVVLAGRWARFFFPVEDPEFRRLQVGGRPAPGADGLRAGLEGTIRALEAKGARVVVVGQSPEFLAPLPGCLARASWRQVSEEVCRFRAETLPGRDHEAVLADVLGRHRSATFVQPSGPLCPGGVCGRWISGAPLTWDTDHLSPAAAGRVVAAWPQARGPGAEPKPLDMALEGGADGAPRSRPRVLRVSVGGGRSW